MKAADSRVAILVDDYFEQPEFEEPLHHLWDLGAHVDVVGTKRKNLRGLWHVKQGDTFNADCLIDDVDFDDYDMLVLPGGAINADALRMIDKARRWVQDYMDKGKMVAAICHAPWLLVSADVVEGRRLTSYFTIQDDIRNAGAEWIDQPTIRDENLITSRQPDDIPAFNAAIATMISRAPTH